MSYTPGPWNTILPNGGCYEVGAYDQTVAIVCSKNKVDAQLIAAAPEMVDLLDDVLLELGIVSSSLPSNCRGHVDELRDRIDALLLRIEGTE